MGCGLAPCQLWSQTSGWTCSGLSRRSCDSWHHRMMSSTGSQRKWRWPSPLEDSQCISEFDCSLFLKTMGHPRPLFGLRMKAKDPRIYLSCCCSCLFSFGLFKKQQKLKQMLKLNHLGIRTRAPLKYDFLFLPTVVGWLELSATLKKLRTQPCGLLTYHLSFT